MNWFSKSVYMRPDEPDDLKVIFDALGDLKDEIDLLKTKLLINSPSSTQELSNRVADLEVKISKLWTLLTTTTPQGQDKLSKYGKVFGGKSKGMI